MEKTEEELTKEQIEEIKALKISYSKTFTSEHGQKVLSDLEDLCFVKKPTYEGDKEGMLINEGLRLVYLHIQTMMKMEPEKAPQDASS